MNLTAIILTLNEAQHLKRCLASLAGVADRVVVVDSFSTDDTLSIAKAYGADVLQHTFVNHASQFNWSLDQLGGRATWILRIDADEYLSQDFSREIRDRLGMVDSSVDGVVCARRIVFQGSLIRFGGLSRIKVLRIFRFGRGRCENRWMDEHIKVAGATVCFRGAIIDDNLNSLTWWTDKHNRYASREAVDLLNLKYGFLARDSIAGLTNGSEAATKRWIKERIYAYLPLGFRALAYFVYRYVVRGGFLDGRAGTSFHVLQGLWYRFLVDRKVAEVERYMENSGGSASEAIAAVLNIRL